MKVLFMTNIPTPYRVVFFNQLAQKCDLHVVFEKETTPRRNKEWFLNNKYNFNYTMLPKKKGLKTLMPILRKDYDIIVIAAYANKFEAIAQLYFKLHKKPYIISADGGFAKDQNFLTKLVKTFFISKATYWLSSGKPTTEYLTYYGAKKDNIYNFHFTSISENEIHEPLSLKEKNILKDEMGYKNKKVFLSIGQMVLRKGYDILLRIVEQEKFSDIVFLIIGTGKMLEEFRSYVKEHNIENVYFLGYKDKREVFKYYQMADVFFLPTREDIWGLVINEAMANGLPIISSDGAISALELLPKSCLYKVNDEKKFINLIKKYSKKSNKELQLEGKNNQERIKKYTIEQMVRDHLECFEKIINRKK